MDVIKEVRCVLLRRNIHLLQSQIAHKKKETNSEWCRRQISVQVEQKKGNLYFLFYYLFYNSIILDALHIETSSIRRPDSCIFSLKKFCIVIP